jgi:hypothetical protein
LPLLLLLLLLSLSTLLLSLLLLLLWPQIVSVTPFTSFDIERWRLHPLSLRYAWHPSFTFFSARDCLGRIAA